MNDKEKHINNWNLPEHQPKSGLWEDIEKELDKPAAVGFVNSLSALPLHKPASDLWNNIENQLDKAPAEGYANILFKSAVPVILFLLTGFFIYYFSFISNKKLLLNKRNYQTENNSLKPENNSLILKDKTSEFNFEENNDIIEKEFVNEKNNTEADHPIKDFIKTEQTAELDQNIVHSSVLQDNRNSAVINNKGLQSSLPFRMLYPKEIRKIDLTVSGIKNYKFIEVRSSDFNLQPLHFEDKNNSILKKFYAGLHYTPEYIYRKNGDVEVQRANNFGLSFGYKFPNVFIESGLELSFTEDNGIYAVNYLQNEVINTYIKVDSILYEFDTINETLDKEYITSDVDVYDSVEYAEDMQTVNRYSYLRIPLLLGYKYDYHKVSLFIKAGAEFSILIHGHEPVPTVNGKEIRIINVDRLSPGRVSTSWQMIIRAGFAVKVYKSLSLTLEPQYRYYLNSYYSQQMNNYKKPYSIGIRAGVLINF
ncbi:MAG: hypothetical protein B6D61_09085 [Bacteroidetes bacterium 4484_249]|nr:MAG: hypothetical protein B6D61_09085 [Bacteroidetes bacterium 4484_249]